MTGKDYNIESSSRHLYMIKQAVRYAFGDLKFTDAVPDDLSLLIISLDAAYGPGIRYYLNKVLYE